MSRLEVDCGLPSGDLEPRDSPSSNVLPNFLAMIRLTDMLEAARDRV